MPQAVISLGELQDRIVQVVKGKYGLKNKSEAVNKIIEEYEDVFSHLEVRPEYLEKLRRIEQEPGRPHFKNAEELDAYFEKLKRNSQARQKTRASRIKKARDS